MVTKQDDLWLGLVDEPIGAIVTELEAEDPELGALVATPEKLLAFRTFANIRVGIVLGRLLMAEEDGGSPGADEAARDRFQEFARRELGG